MKKCLRIALAVTLLAFAASLPSYATDFGGAPAPPPEGISSVRVVVSVILSVLGL
jgi:hypothetical protein